MSTRDTILAAVRSNRPSGDHPLPDLPDFDLDDGGDRTAFFVKNLKSMGGKTYDGPLGDAIKTLFPDAKIVVSRVPEITGTRELKDDEPPRDLHDIDVAVVRAQFGIAETGTVALTDTMLGVNSLAYLAQHLIVLVDPKDIVLTVQDAYRRDDYTAHRYLAFHTGPSATADIEGVLIHGAQGVRSLTVILHPRTS